MENLCVTVSESLSVIEEYNSWAPTAQSIRA